ncbi:MAG: hypothetical protein HC808_18440 [Candidatus Competibacteraceae bacterium]|nr:hypothetical protein [Candidatus Competibacteraceae bacterium]
MNKKFMVYAAWLQIILAVVAVYALRWADTESTHSEFFLRYWWVWPAVLMLVASGAISILINRR